MCQQDGHPIIPNSEDYHTTYFIPTEVQEDLNPDKYHHGDRHLLIEHKLNVGRDGVNPPSVASSVAGA